LVNLHFLSGTNVAVMLRGKRQSREDFSVKHQMTLLTLMTLRRYIAVVAVLCHPLYLAAQTRDDHKIQIFGGYSYFLTDDGVTIPLSFSLGVRGKGCMDLLSKLQGV